MPWAPTRRQSNTKSADAPEVQGAEWGRSSTMYPTKQRNRQANSVAFGRRCTLAGAAAALTAMAAIWVAAAGATALAQTEGGILFSDVGAGGSDLYVIDVAGAGRRAITSSRDIAEAQGDWSPDRRAVSYTALHGSLWRLGVLDLGSGSAQPATSGPEDFEPDWSPDGRRLLFTSYFNRNTINQSSFIMTAAPDGSAAQPVIELRNPSYYLGNPRWSPDASQVVFTVGSISEGGTLYIMAADGTGARVLLKHSGWDDIDPAWSPDGGRIAFASGQNSGSTTSTRHDIWLLDVAQNIAGTVIVDDARDLRRPAWSPDGLQLAIDSRKGSGPAERYSIHVAPALGGPIGEAITTGREPDWSGVPRPTSTQVALTPTLAPTVPLTATNEATATPPDLTEVPPLPTLPTFPTIPPTAPTEPGPAPTFPPASATPPPPPTATPTDGPGPTFTATAHAVPWRILLPIASNRVYVIAPPPAGPVAVQPHVLPRRAPER
jgi:TolB protein